jgi:hypothetical protein
MDAEGEFYRIVAQDPLAEQDFQTSQEAGTFLNRSPCLRCGLSVYRDLLDAMHTRRKYPRLGTRIARGHLENNHGKVQQTFRPSHHTWWAYDGLSRALLFVVVAEEEG